MDVLISIVWLGSTAFLSR